MYANRAIGVSVMTETGESEEKEEGCFDFVKRFELFAARGWSVTGTEDGE